MARAVVECAQCGQADDHPKAHVGDLVTGEVLTKHHDCLSVREKELLVGSAQAAGSGPKASAVIEACAVKGVKGDKLLALIQSGKLPQAEGLHEAEQAALEATA